MFQRMIEENLVPPKSWTCQVRVGDITPEIAKLMKQAGCALVCLGVESADDATLKAVNKAQEAGEIRICLKTLRDAGIESLSMTIVGFDTDTLKSFWQSIKKLYQWGTTYLQVLALTPLPGTVMTKKLQEEGRVLSSNYDLRNGMHVTIRSELMSELDAWKGLYLVSAWFYLFTPRGWRMAIKRPKIYFGMISIVLLQLAKRIVRT